MTTLLTTSDVAGILRRSPRFVLRLVRNGLLSPVALGGAVVVGTPGRKDYRFTREAVEDLLAPVTPAPKTQPAQKRERVAPARPVPCWDGISRSGL